MILRAEERTGAGKRRGLRRNGVKRKSRFVKTGNKERVKTISFIRVRLVAEAVRAERRY